MTFTEVPATISLESEAEVSEVFVIKEKGQSWVDLVIEFLECGKQP